MEEALIRFGVLGAARITPAALIYPCMNEPAAEICCVAARDSLRAKEFAKAHGIARKHNNYEEVLADPNINAIYNPLPISLHHTYTLQAIAAGKHVLCEKSLACNAFQATEMNAAARKAGLVLMDAFHYRYHPLFIRAKQIYDSGELGTIRSIDARFHVPIIDPKDIRMQYEFGGGVTMDIGCYPISWVRHLSGLEPRVLEAFAEVGPPFVDTRLVAKMELPGGISASIEGDMRGDVTFLSDIRVVGSTGEMLIENPLQPHCGHQLSITKAGKTRYETLDRRTTYCYQLDAFIAAVQYGNALPTDGDDAVRQLVVIDRCYELAGLPLRGLDTP